MRIVLGVGGGIAAYKVASLLRLFTEAGHDVTVIPTEAARPASSASPPGRPCPATRSATASSTTSTPSTTSGWAIEAELIVVAPATADLLARAATGQASDLLSNTLLMARGPVLIAPAMHTEMWQHPATQANVATLRSRGVTVLEPASGRLTGPDSGPGRLPEPEAHLRRRHGPGRRRPPDSRPALRHDPRPLPVRQPAAAGRTVTVTPAAPASRWTPSGSWATAPPASRAWRWPLPPATPAPPSGCWPPTWTSRRRPASTWSAVETALELREAVLHAAADSDVVIMAAAVADFRPAESPAPKSRSATTSPTPSSPWSGTRTSCGNSSRSATPGSASQLIVGFAAETGDADGDVLDYAAAKLRRKALRPAGGQPGGTGQGLRRRTATP